MNNTELRQVSISDVRPSPENELIYHRINPDDDPSIWELARSIDNKGILEPLVVSSDLFILSGHRRHAAAILAGLETVPARVVDIERGDPGYLQLIREYNRQRVKTIDEAIKEVIIDDTPEEARRRLIADRIAKSEINVVSFKIEAAKKRPEISDGKNSFLNAVIDLLNSMIKYWPLTVRQIHYNLLNNPPLKHSAKPDSVYKNDRNSYQDLSKLLSRARIENIIPFYCIADGTRPHTPGAGWTNAQSFIKNKVGIFLKGYRRDLQASQPNHVEIVGEKNTIQATLQRAADPYCVPVTISRGYCSIAPRYEMAQRFKNSGKSKLITILVSDCDPEGDEIAMSFAQSMRRDFHISIHPIRAALTRDQVERFNLPDGGSAKTGSANYKKFIERHGSDRVYELEALHPAQLEQVIKEAIESVLDHNLFNEEIRQEERDEMEIAKYRKAVIDFMGR